MFDIVLFFFSVSFVLFLGCLKENHFSFKKLSPDNLLEEETIMLGDRIRLDYDIRFGLVKITGIVFFISILLAIIVTILET